MDLVVPEDGSEEEVGVDMGDFMRATLFLLLLDPLFMIWATL
jgi:hypothetical protein